LIAVALCGLCAQVFAQKAPPKAEWDKASADIGGTDDTARAAATAKVRVWIAGGWVSMDLWRHWLPALVKAGKHADVADLAMEGLLRRPGPEGITPLLDFRLKALLALDRTDEALRAAKSYYNVCDLKYTAGAVETLALVLARTHPDDLEIARRFRAEQAAAAAGRPPAGPSTLAEIKVDASLYKGALDQLSLKTRFSDRVGYAHLLLAADRGQDAEKVFRELFQIASNQADLTTAAEGIAKALRAQDGNVARANAWLVTFQQHASTQPAPAPAPARGGEVMP
jgi:hypothetical protein